MENINDNSINNNERIYITLMRGFDQCYDTMEWKNFSTVRYTLPDYFQDPSHFGAGPDLKERWHNEVLTHVGEKFNYQWMPIGNPAVWTDKELEERKDV